VQQETRHLFNRVMLRRMKPPAILIYTARGPIVATSSAHHSFGRFVTCMPRRVAALTSTIWSVRGASTRSLNRPYVLFHLLQPQKIASHDSAGT
jgi:D-isomer specific 2-hydroxyacid dehydrogenase, NAD binding domain